MKKCYLFNKFNRLIIVIIFLMIVPLGLSGCYREAVEQDVIPDVIWPKPPDMPRIKLVNAVRAPRDLQIREGSWDTFMKYFTGKSEISLISPYGIEVDHDGRLFIVDTQLRAVVVFYHKGKISYTFPGPETSFIHPIDIAIDKKGLIYVTDSADKSVKIFSDAGKTYLKDIGRGFFERPTGIAVNEHTGELLVIDTANSEILRFSLTDHTFLGKISRPGNDIGQLHYPTNIIVNSKGHIIVSDSLNFRVQTFDAQGKYMHSFGKPGNVPGYFARPKGVAVDSDDNIYVVDTLFDNVQMFNSDGALLMDFGKAGREYGEFWLPTGIFIDSNDYIYVADTYNKRVQVFKYLKGEELLSP
ncbi:MAG: SMP-30/gluconolactonase/LRE family protein [Nitrospira sp.]|nr:SMP-30/gluconolactonase/LRE family protein [bacterium]MBL7050121.1 SMP-30/gluconolactonase/LRE family protein [Nitrospira sp.]